MRTLVVLSLCLLFAGPAKARNVEAGKFIASGTVGPSIRLGSRLGGSRASLMLQGGGEYTFSKQLSAIGDVGLGLSGTVPLKFHVGGRYRLADLDLPISPYGQAQLAFGRLYDVIGADMGFFGVRGAAGADYFLTAQFGVGAQLGLELTSTLADAKAFYGTFDIFAYATYTF
jgi:hypothetical protein